MSTYWGYFCKDCKKETDHWKNHGEEILGYTAVELKNHLINKFTNGMTWDKLLKAEIHIDHKIPKSYFYFESIEDEGFKRAWALENLQPLWAKDNLEKSYLIF